VTTLLAQLWDDDNGAVISSELILVLGVLVLGLIPGLVALRNSVNAALTTIGNFLNRITPSFTFSGYAVVGEGTINTIAQVGGLQIDYTTGTQLSAVQVVPTLDSDNYDQPYNVVPAP
jgi:Flp pilus assembly pilin Flp